MHLSIRVLLSFLLLVAIGRAAEDVASESQNQEQPPTAAQEAAEDSYQVPKGGGQELLEFLKQLEQRKQEVLSTYKEAQRKAQDQYTQSLNRCNAAGKIAAERVMALQLDPTSEAVIAAAEFVMPDRLKGFTTANEEVQKETIAMVTSLLESRSKNGLEMKDLTLARSFVQVFEKTDQIAMAADTCRFFDNLFRKSGNAQLARFADYFATSAKRFALIGNPLELTGMTVDGVPLDWSSYRGKYVLVDFWASWCGPCRAELPKLKKYYRIYHDRGLEIVGISLDRDEKQLEAYLKEEQIPWNNLYDRQARGSHPVAKLYGISAIPTMFLVDKEGKVVSLQARARLSSLLTQYFGGPYGEALPFVLKGDWKNAADASKKVLQIDTGGTWPGMALPVAVAQLLGDDVEGYQETCREAFKNSAKSGPYSRFGLTRLCYLSPNSGISTQQIAEMLQTDMSRVSPKALAIMKGMHEFRVGNYEAAMAHFPKSGGDSEQIPTSLLFRAMTAHKLGQASTAEQLLQQGIKEMETRIPTPDGPPIAAYLPNRWVCWGRLQIIRREAEGMIGTAAEKK